MSVQVFRTVGDVATRPEPVAATGALSAERWDRFVEATPGGDLVQTTAWAQAKRALGFEVGQVVSRHGDDIVGGGQIVMKRFGPLGAVGYVARGPLVRAGCPEQAALVLDDIERAARAQRVRHLVVQPPEGGAAIAAALAARGYAENAPAVAPAATLRIDLSQDLDRLLASMSRSKRKEIRRSERGEVEIRVAGSGHLDLFHALHEATARRQRFRGMSRAYLRHHWEALHPRGWTKLFVAYHRDTPLAAQWVAAFGDTVCDRATGWNGEGRHLQANVALQWHIIRWAKEQGFRWFDLGGIDRRYAELILAEQPIPDEFQQTPATFKRELGAHPVLLPVAGQFTFNPIARLFGAIILSQFTRRKTLRKLVQYVRTG